MKTCSPQHYSRRWFEYSSAANASARTLQRGPCSTTLQNHRTVYSIERLSNCSKCFIALATGPLRGILHASSSSEGVTRSAFNRDDDHLQDFIPEHSSQPTPQSQYQHGLFSSSLPVFNKYQFSTSHRNMKIFIASVLALYISLACAHSSISEPISYRTRARALYCKGAECKKACPEYYRNTALMRNTIERPARTYRRGQRIDLRWTRNNHFGGIMRVSLVPVKKMDSRTWHHRLTLMHGCWSNNRHICRKNEYCGTDRTKSAFETKLTIPTIFPDGMYVMGFLWYGGLRQGRGKFQDYYTCSFVRIKGGLPVGGSHKPYFEPGNGAENEGGKCKTSTDYPGPCERNGCRGKKAILAVPKAVRRGMDKIFPNLVRSAM